MTTFGSTRVYRVIECFITITYLLTHHPTGTVCRVFLLFRQRKARFHSLVLSRVVHHLLLMIPIIFLVRDVSCNFHYGAVLQRLPHIKHMRKGVDILTINRYQGCASHKQRSNGATSTGREREVRKYCSAAIRYAAHIESSKKRIEPDDRFQYNIKNCYLQT